MKKITKIIAMVALFAATLTLPTGCGTVPPADQGVIDATAAVLRGAARDGAVVAITPPTGNTNNAVYFNLAANAISTFVTGKDYTPGALQNALMGINVPQLNDPYVRVGIGTVVDLYQLYYGIYALPNLKTNAPVALEFLTAIQDGFNQALGNPVSSATPQLRRLGAGAVTGGVTLPRPITPFKPSKK